MYLLQRKYNINNKHIYFSFSVDNMIYLFATNKAGDAANYLTAMDVNDPTNWQTEIKIESHASFNRPIVFEVNYVEIDLVKRNLS